MTGAELIAAERQRQIEVECWAADHDDRYVCRELVLAAQCYASASGVSVADAHIPDAWPWAGKWWKPKDPISNLARAGALIAAEIDRLQRIKE
jgi:hypothetical protein